MDAGPENAGVQSKGHDGGNVGDVKSALGGVLAMMSSNIGIVKRLSCGDKVDGEGLCGMLLLPMVDEAVYRVNETVLRH